MTCLKTVLACVAGFTAAALCFVGFGAALSWLAGLLVQWTGSVGLGLALTLIILATAVGAIVGVIICFENRERAVMVDGDLYGEGVS